MDMKSISLYDRRFLSFKLQPHMDADRIWLLKDPFDRVFVFYR